MEESKELFKDIEKHLLNDVRPSEYLNEQLNKGNLNKYPFTMLSDLVHTEQNKEHHPEGNVWNHTLLVVDKAAENREKSSDKRAFMWGSLLHDIGKAKTTKVRKGKITSYNHDKVGETMSREFLQCFSEDEDFIYKVIKLVRWHMQTLFVVKNMSFADSKNMLKETSLDEIALLSLCDRLGRQPMSNGKIQEEKENVRTFVRKVKELNKV
ncbi:putative nucleotidyltransferase with HDIG domain [Clostridium acetobutylicum]|uniref:HD superfamily hydrolase n=1 Tax=Clostridium acetobutylicum (strain ATCC 824 / DSM 792 / JCM 1419 / IAM 19013 / LMG 5710 / NBRC 13948 / NRRL B-527 / VKM B-1787 / 2291 / W) TaxID=272562 RepID=Q97DB7_CLOAB|nr:MULTISPECIES: HDIG domain-containing metalloprotein [Clostridium]AAK81486.1 HD superfamily hydrolase [Clostridium acetobutylicum ATCC 824]ADZ22605.1 HD superfamily hydrolase [Clostridium acetobutylicum EA 2018]AEI32934.1 HD superfamily hydrolase [Clostridium acetobutylicum DSM 1731]AWV80840.1 CCA tRNA nucleotidyltransferase [Clostridium acetobutylicum]MBC2393833.1 CCA tRNA nucleotidyltransferase [Clostridium acetobutylicum]